MRSLLLLLLMLFFIPQSFLFAQSPTPNNSIDSDRYREVENQIKELEGRLSETRDKGRTLASEIAYMDNQIKRVSLNINLTEKKIADLTSEIASLSAKINTLEVSLTQISNLLINRIVTTYKQSSTSTLSFFMNSGNVDDLLLRLKYIRIAQTNDKRLLYQIQESKDTFSSQKQAREGKRREQQVLEAQLIKQKADLDSKKAAKALLLASTKNDEDKYQQLLSAARAEFEAIQSIVAGKGDETDGGKINEGQKIASIIQGPSCNSSGAHLHFIVSSHGNTQNPFSYLKNADFENCSGSSCTSSDGDPFNPSGSWDWPISPKIKYSQGYGATWAVRNTWVGRVYNFHNGIDINSDSSDIKAVRSGVLYRGSYLGYNGCRLRYVRVHHDDADLDTFYLHVNY